MIEGAKEQENEIEGGERRMLQTGFFYLNHHGKGIVPLGLHVIHTHMNHLHIEII